MRMKVINVRKAEVDEYGLKPETVRIYRSLLIKLKADKKCKETRTRQ